MLNIESAVPLGTTVLPESAAPAGANSSTEATDLFSLALEVETRDLMPLSGPTVASGPESPGAAALAAQSSTPPEAASTAPDAKTQDSDSQGKTGLPASLVGLAWSEPAWQNLPMQESPEEPQAQPAPVPANDAVTRAPTVSAPADSKSATPVTAASMAASMDASMDASMAASMDASIDAAIDAADDAFETIRETGSPSSESRPFLVHLDLETEAPAAVPAGAPVEGQPDPVSDPAPVPDTGQSSDPGSAAGPVPTGNFSIPGFPVRSAQSETESTSPEVPADTGGHAAQDLPAIGEILQQAAKGTVPAVPEQKTSPRRTEKTSQSLDLTVQVQPGKSTDDKTTVAAPPITRETLLVETVRKDKEVPHVDHGRAEPAKSEAQDSSNEASTGAVAPVPAGLATESTDQDPPDRQSPNPQDHEIPVATAREKDARPDRPPDPAHAEARSPETQGHFRTNGFVHELKAQTGGPARPHETFSGTEVEQWSQIEKSDVLSQLVEKARSFRWEKDSEIVVSLKPESLGRIHMRASFVDRTMIATISAESDKVRHLIQLEVPTIQNALHEHGIHARVEVSHQSSLDFTHNSSGNGQSGQPGQPRFRQDSPSPMTQPATIPLASIVTAETADSRYSAHSLHLIA